MLNILKSIFVVLFLFVILGAVAVIGKHTHQKTKNVPMCVNMCGNTLCEQYVCIGIGCICSETIVSCPQDCNLSYEKF